MAKWSRTKVGEVIKGKVEKDAEGNVIKRDPDYIKVYQDVVLKKGDYLNLETKDEQIKSVNKAKENGKLDEEMTNKILERLNKIPDFVRFEIVQVKKEG